MVLVRSRYSSAIYLLGAADQFAFLVCRSQAIFFAPLRQNQAVKTTRSELRNRPCANQQQRESRAGAEAATSAKAETAAKEPE
jgi:hypothetical protein